MQLSEITPIMVALIAFAGVLWQGRRPRFDSRDRLRKDLELLAAMPDDLEIKSDYKRHISEAVRVLIKDEDRRTRNPSGVIFGMLVLAAGGWLMWAAIDQGGGWWHFLTAFGVLLLLFGAIGISDDLAKRHRDESGRIIRRTQADTSSDR